MHPTVRTLAMAVAAAIVLPPVLALGGCNPAPKSSAELRAAGPEALREASSEYWRDRAPAIKGNSPRVVLAEFAVEFITSKHRSPSDRQAAFVPPHPILLAAGAAGVGLKRVEFDEDAFAQIAADLERVFRDEAARAGIVLVEPPADLDRAEPGEPRVASEINIGASDTGRIKGVHLQPAPGSGLLTRTTRRELEQDLRAALESVTADAAARVHLRVGVYNGYASCEQGSTIEIVTRNAIGQIVSRASLLSDEEVLADDATDSRYPVDTESYRREIRSIAPLYVRMGLLEAAE